jgi:hypothetical protein
VPRKCALPLITIEQPQCYPKDEVTDGILEK